MQTFISVDCECAGPTPEYNLCSIGACEVGNIENDFLRTLHPVTDKYIPEALAVGGWTWDEEGYDLNSIQVQGRPPKFCMLEFRKWLTQFQKPVMVGFNAPFDWQFINYYMWKYCGDNILGINCIDIKSLYMGMTGCEWKKTTKSSIPKKYHSTIPHTHNALDDAKGQAEMFEKMMEAIRA